MRLHLNKEEHFSRLRETTEAVGPVIIHAYDGLGLNARLREIIDLWVSKRIAPNQRLLRPYLVRIAYEIAGGRSWQSILNAGAAVEIFNISTYQSNLAFDEKAGVHSSQQKNNQFIASMLSFDLAISLLQTLLAVFPQNMVSSIISGLCIANSAVYQGQHQDLNMLHVGSWDTIKVLSETEFLHEYMMRCQFMDGRQIGFCLELGAMLAQANPQTIELLGNVGEMFGIALQIVNDLSDFVPTEKKPYQDAYTDIRQGKITLPVYHVLRDGDPLSQNRFWRVLNGESVTDEDLWEMTLDICRSGAFVRIKEVVEQQYKAIHQRILQLPDSDNRCYLMFMYPHLVFSKFVRFFEALCKNI